MKKSETLPESISEGETIMGMHVVIIGNPLEGFKVYGPFKTYDDAAAWTDDASRSHLESWIMPLRGEDEI